MITRRTLSVASLIGGLTALAPSAFAAKRLEIVTFLANYTFAGRDTPFFAGRDNGTFRNAGFDVNLEPTTGSGFVLTAVDSNKAAFGLADAGTVIQGIARGAKVKAFMVFMDATPNGLVSLKPYPTPKSLYGARIAASQTDDVRIVLPIIFHEKGLDISKIHWIDADPSVYVSLLLSGQTDLYTATADGDVPALEAIVAQQRKKVYFASFFDWGYDLIAYLLITQADRIKNHPDQVKDFAAAVAKSVSWSEAHPAEATTTMAKDNPTLKRDIIATQWRESVKFIETPYVKQHGYGVASAKRIEDTINLVSKAVKLPRVPSAAEVFAEGLIGS